MPGVSSFIAWSRRVGSGGRSAWLPFVLVGSVPAVRCRIGQGLAGRGVYVVPHGGFGAERVFMLDHFEDCTVFPGGGFYPARMFHRAKHQPLVGELVHQALIVLD